MPIWAMANSREAVPRAKLDCCRLCLLTDRLHQVSMVTRDRCKQSTAAFWAGLAAPTALFEAPVSYLYYVAANSIHRAFGQVAWHVNNAVSAYREQSGHSFNTQK